jgi:hypothetical protein
LLDFEPLDLVPLALEAFFDSLLALLLAAFASALRPALPSVSPELPPDFAETGFAALLFLSAALLSLDFADAAAD